MQSESNSKEKAKLFSIVTTAFNEGKNLPQLIAEVEAVLPKLSQFADKVEFIIVNDGSTDETAEVLTKAPEFVRGIDIPHSGMSMGLYIGVNSAKGELIATMDADLQNDPADLYEMVRRLVVENADMVTGIRRRRRDSGLRKFYSWLGNRFRALLLDDVVSDSGCTLRVFRGAMREFYFLPFDGGHRFVANMVVLSGHKLIEVEVNHRERRFGKANFGFCNRFPRVIFDLFGLRWLVRRSMFKFLNFKSQYSKNEK